MIAFHEIMIARIGRRRKHGAIGVAEAALRGFYGDVTPADWLVDMLAVPQEQDVSLVVSTQPKTTLQALWPRLDQRCDSCSR
jgi:hypothetical protein